MGQALGRVREIRVGPGGCVEVCIGCPEESIPCAGQFLLAVDPTEVEANLPTPVFAIEKSNHGFWGSPTQNIRWSPGTVLDLVGPLGHGFDLPDISQRLGLVALGETVSRLLPLVRQALKMRISLTLFTDLDLPTLPSALEAYPLASLPDALDWPDFLALDMPLERITELRYVLGLSTGGILTCPAQILIITPMPCAAIAQCGACAVPGRRGWKLVCEDGPVFNLNDLKW
jgi:hypothetical protein